MGFSVKHMGPTHDLDRIVLLGAGEQPAIDQPTYTVDLTQPEWKADLSHYLTQANEKGDQPVLYGSEATEKLLRQQPDIAKLYFVNPHVKELIQSGLTPPLLKYDGVTSIQQTRYSA